MLLYCNKSIPCYIVQYMIQYGSVFCNIVTNWLNCTVLYVIQKGIELPMASGAARRIQTESQSP